MRLLLVAVLVLPLAAADVFVTPEVVATTLYLHPLNPQDMPINTQVPQPEIWNEGGFGATANTMTCLHPTSGPVTGGLTSQAFASYFGYSTLSFVGYDRVASDGSPRVHPTRGLTYNTTIIGTPTLYWSMTPTQTTQIPSLGAANVVVEAKLRAPEGVSVDDRGYDTGTILMAGQSAAVTLVGSTVAGPGSSQVTVDQVDGRFVYTFAVPLPVQNPVIPQATGYNLRIDVRMDVPGCEPGTAIMPGVLEPFASISHLSRIELTNQEPLRQQPMRVQAGRNNITFVTNTTSAWGSYDVNVPNVTFLVTGPTQATPELRATIWRTVEHFHLADPVLQTWVLDTGDLPDGAYTAVYRATNLQGTATAESIVTFVVADGQLQSGPPRQVPLPFVTLVVALGLALLTRRR